ncbi:MAG: ATP-binding protein [Anaeromicrobium sp.]|jgi:adenylate kinase|uniref:ATP-binding protein n=1 Tax=Anaeromicrobium sp. TaxID=1929132 RepID=UPI0025D98B11|nr:ATP-binding protein [Anaeromicrobium sp.]MCT4594626.1 ATP-binding protein [Anaeromicrobium sp.]
MRKNIIFISGIHGVGKTTFAKSMSKKYGIEYYSSSELISNNCNKKFDSKLTNEIDENQNQLLNAVEKLLNKKKIYFLDGHFCLLDKKLYIKRIPLGTYMNLGIKAIILLVDSVENINNRLNYRDNRNYELDLISEFQKQELNYANEIASMLDVPIICIDIGKCDIDNHLRVEELIQEYV